jgi:effector-binding domain-containing protein
MSYEFAIRKVSPQPTMSIRGQTTLAGLRGTIEEYVSEVWRHVQRLGGKPTGPPFTRYHAVDGQRIDLEAGFPVRSALAAEDRVRPRELPGGEVAVTTHVGPYEGLVTAGEALAGWIRAQGREAAGPNWEVYLAAPGDEPDPARWRTEIVKPLK